MFDVADAIYQDVAIGIVLVQANRTATVPLTLGLIIVKSVVDLTG